MKIHQCPDGPRKRTYRPARPIPLHLGAGILIVSLIPGCDTGFPVSIPVESCAACPEPVEVAMRRTCDASENEVTESWGAPSPLESATIEFPEPGCYQLLFMSDEACALRGVYVQTATRFAPEILALQERRWGLGVCAIRQP